MVHRHTHGDVVWVDMVSPTQDEVRTAMSEFSIDPLIADELLAPSVRNRVDAREAYFYVVLHFPAFKHMHDLSGVALEIDFVIGKNWIITTRYNHLDPLHQYAAQFEVESVLDRNGLGTHAGIVFYRMLTELYRTLNDELAHIGVRLDAAEDRVFKGFEREMVIELSYISRDLLNYAQALDSHRSMLETVETPGVALFGYEYARHVRSVLGEYERLATALKSHRASLSELRETNNSLLTTKQNEIMKLFTVMAFLMFPLSLIAGVFGMNTDNMPFSGNPLDFWIIIGIMVSVAVLFFAYFRYKHWL